MIGWSILICRCKMGLRAREDTVGVEIVRPC